MLLTRRDFRAIIFYEYTRGLTEEQCRESLAKTFGESAMLEQSYIDACYIQFRKTRAYLDDCEVKPRTRVVTTEYVEAVKRLLRNDPRIRCQEIEKTLGISTTVVDKIMDEYLHLKKQYDYWVPKVINGEHKEDRLHWCRLMVRTLDNGLSADMDNVVTGSEIWIHRYEAGKSDDSGWAFGDDEKYKAAQTKSKRQSASIAEKRMIACFFTKNGYFTTVQLNPKLTRPTVVWFTDTCLPQLMSVWKSKNTKGRELWLHHDKTHPLTASKTISFIHEIGARLLPHPPYSPDLAPADYFLFRNVRRHFAGRRYPTAEAAISAYQAYVNVELNAEACKEVFKEWFVRIRRCSRVEGGCFDEEDTGEA